MHTHTKPQGILNCWTVTEMLPDWYDSTIEYPKVGININICVRKTMRINAWIISIWTAYTELLSGNLSYQAHLTFINITKLYWSMRRGPTEIPRQVNQNSRSSSYLCLLKTLTTLKLMWGLLEKPDNFMPSRALKVHKWLQSLSCFCQGCRNNM